MDKGKESGKGKNARVKEKFTNSMSFKGRVIP